MYLILLIRENIWCWPFAILSSALSIYLFYEAKLYSEAVLYSFYVVIGIYAWYVWATGVQNEKSITVSEWHRNKHIGFFTVTAAFALLLGYYFSKKTDAANAYADAASTSFSFLASFMEAYKILSAWIYWIVLNVFSIWLYHQRGLKIYSLLMIFYAILSAYGFYQWRKKYVATSVTNSL